MYRVPFLKSLVWLNLGLNPVSWAIDEHPTHLVNGPVKFKLSYNAEKVTKNICYVKCEATIDPSKVTRWLKNFAQVIRNFMIRKGQIDLKPWIQRPCFLSKRQIWLEEHREYEMSLASHSPVWFITFITIELCLI